MLTPSQESEQAEIELKEDDPDALEGVLRYIYGCEVDDWDPKPWRYWLDLVETADKYLEPKLSKTAAERFEISALSLQEMEVEAICEVLQTLQDTERYELFESFAIDLTVRHLQLLDDEQFRAQVYSSKPVMCKLIERLSFAAKLVPVKLLCQVHGEQVYYQKEHYTHCEFVRCSR